MNNSKFWTWFDQEAAPRLAHREVSFRKIFRHLDQFLTRSLVIVETGCVRKADNWAGDGQSTVLFDRYIQCAPHGGRLFTVDIDPSATSECKRLVSPGVEVHTEDSVLFLSKLAAQFRATGASIDLLYLDSFDLDWGNPAPSAAHHLKELAAISPVIRTDTLVVVDDAPCSSFLMIDDRQQATLVRPPTVSGKGLLVAEYAAAVDATLQFSHYQVAWTNMVR